MQASRTDLPSRPASYGLALEEWTTGWRIESGQMPFQIRCWRATTLTEALPCWRFAASGSMLYKTRSRYWTKAVCKRGGKNETPP